MSDTKRNRAIVKRVAAGTSIKAIADEFGITKQRVSQIHISLTGGAPAEAGPVASQTHSKTTSVARSRIVPR